MIERTAYHVAYSSYIQLQARREAALQGSADAADLFPQLPLVFVIQFNHLLHAHGGTLCLDRTSARKKALAEANPAFAWHSTLPHATKQQRMAATLHVP